MTRSTLLAAATALALVAADSPEAAQKESAKLQGTWVRVAVEADGQALPPEALAKQPKLIFKGDAYELVSDTEARKGVYKLDPTKKPKTMDIIPSEGPNKGKVMLGIYELSDDRLRYCFDPTGKQRPTEFSTKAGSGFMYYDNKREK